jgi:segregation and condensation protein A
MNDSQVIDHLLTSGSLQGERLERYLELVQDCQGEHSYIRDPFDRSIAMVFELVMQEHLDPWELDLVSFSSLYLKRAKNNGVDLVTAGRIILLAWRVLKLQSYHVIENMEAPPPVSEAEMNWDDLPGWYEEDDSYYFTRMIMEGQTPLDEKIRRKGKRKVTLLELVDAFEEIRKDVTNRETLQKERERFRKKNNRDAEKNIDSHIVKEDTEKDLLRIWERISQFNGNDIPLTNLCDLGDRIDLIKTLSSLLFLADENKIKVWQRRFPYGDIYVKVLNGHAQKTKTN